MFRLFPVVMILQGYCLYHAFSNKAEQKWYWLIIFLPILGSLFYLYHHFYSRQNVENISEGIKGVVNTNYQVEKMEKLIQNSDTVTNKTKLGDMYMGLQRYTEAADIYESCLVGFNESDPATMIRLVKVNYFLKEHEKAIFYGNQLIDNRNFKDSEEKACYAWSLYENDQTDLAEKVFEEMDVSSSNYPQRMEYCKFLHNIGKKKEAISKLEELLVELDRMQSYEKRMNRDITRTIRLLYDQMRR